MLSPAPSVATGHSKHSDDTTERQLSDALRNLVGRVGLEPTTNELRVTRVYETDEPVARNCPLIRLRNCPVSARFPGGAGGHFQRRSPARSGQTGTRHSAIWRRSDKACHSVATSTLETPLPIRNSPVLLSRHQWPPSRKRPIASTATQSM